MNYRNFVLLNAEIYFLIAIVAIICMILFNSCQERTDPNYKDRTRVNVEDTKQYQKFKWPDSTLICIDSVKYQSLKDSLEQLKLINQMYKSMIEFQKDEILRMKTDQKPDK